MRVVLQRVSEAKVTVDGNITGQINHGLLILLGVEDADTEEDIIWLSNKISNIRIFDDENGVMNKSVSEVDGSILLISQFTLFAATKKGNRPSYIKAANSEYALRIYQEFLEIMKYKINKDPFSGIFGADMLVKIENDGPVTIFIDSKNKE